MKTAELRGKLRAMKTSQLKRLADLSGISERCLWMIRAGDVRFATETTIESVKPHIRQAMRTRALG